MGDFQLHVGSLSGASASISFQTGGGGRSGSYSDYCTTPVLDWVVSGWYNIQVVRSSNILTLYQDGTSVAQVAMTEPFEASTAAEFYILGFAPRMIFPRRPDWMIFVFTTALCPRTRCSNYMRASCKRGCGWGHRSQRTALSLVSRPPPIWPTRSFSAPTWLRASGRSWPMCRPNRRTARRK